MPDVFLECCRPMAPAPRWQLCDQATSRCGHQSMSASGGKAGNICSLWGLPVLTHMRHRASPLFACWTLRNIGLGLSHHCGLMFAARTTLDASPTSSTAPTKPPCAAFSLGSVAVVVPNRTNSSGSPANRPNCDEQHIGGCKVRIGCSHRLTPEPPANQGRKSMKTLSTLLKLTIAATTLAANVMLTSAVANAQPGPRRGSDVTGGRVTAVSLDRRPAGKKVTRALKMMGARAKVSMQRYSQSVA